MGPDRLFVLQPGELIIYYELEEGESSSSRGIVEVCPDTHRWAMARPGRWATASPPEGSTSCLNGPFAVVSGSPASWRSLRKA